MEGCKKVEKDYKFSLGEVSRVNGTYARLAKRLADLDSRNTDAVNKSDLAHTKRLIEESLSRAKGTKNAVWRGELPSGSRGTSSRMGPDSNLANSTGIPWS